MAKKNGRRYIDSERARILAAAEKQGLNGVQAAKKFGISTLTFYTWKKAKTAARMPPTARRSADVSPGSLVRAEVQARVREFLPDLIREEVAIYLRQVLGTRH